MAVDTTLNTQYQVQNMSHKTKILLAEDDRTLSLLLKYRMEKEGYEVRIAMDGNEAVEMVKKVHPDIIISDVMMPYMNGFEVISHVRNNLKLTIPINVFSSAGQEEMILKSLKHSMILK